MLRSMKWLWPEDSADSTIELVAADVGPGAQEFTDEQPPPLPPQQEMEYQEHEERSDPLGDRMGMWLFLFTELLLFGGLFLLYAVYRSQFPEDFAYAAGTLDSGLGTINTLVLLTSSLSMALAVVAISKGRRQLSAFFVSCTLLAGSGFMWIKYLEWSHKIEHSLYPESAGLLRHTQGENIFYGLYYATTGLHGIHVLVGMLLMVVLLYLLLRRPQRSFRVPVPGTDCFTIHKENGDTLWRHQDGPEVQEARVCVYYRENAKVGQSLFVTLENSGLYWHLVDVIWIFLFPLFYLIS